jgi:hypothetical protein
VPDRIEDKVATRVKSDEKTKLKLLKSYDNVKSREVIKNSLNKILKQHKDTKIFLILMGKWFFIGFILFKYFIKGIVIYIIYKKT